MQIENFITEAIKAYAICALWSSCDEDGEPLDARFGPEDISSEASQEFVQDVTYFVYANWDDVKDLGADATGHDFWLTRNGHGAGFWDRGLGDLGERLTKASKVYGGVDLYVGDDDQVHI